MGSAQVQQLQALSALFRRALDICAPVSAAVLGIAGGNGLEHIANLAMTRVVGFDINAKYLDETRRRFGARANLELHCVDLSEDELTVEPVALVHAALFFEHAGLDRALENALSLVARGGRLSVVLQLPESEQQSVTRTPYLSIQALSESFALVDVAHFRSLMQNYRFEFLKEERLSLPTRKLPRSIDTQR